MATATGTRLEVGHVGLNVTDLARSTRFYREALDLDLAGESTAPGREYAFLARDGHLLLTLWRQSDGAAPTDRPGLHHLAFQVDDIKMAYVFYASGLSVNVMWTVGEGGKRAVGFKLSDGMDIPEELGAFKFARQLVIDLGK